MTEGALSLGKRLLILNKVDLGLHPDWKSGIRLIAQKRPI